METKKKEYFKITSRMEQEIREHGEKTGRSPFVLLDVDCGKGKTTEALKLLARRLRPGETGLYLVPRKSLLQSIENKVNELGLSGRIVVMTHQAFTRNIPDIVVNMFAWVVVDEVQECILMAPYHNRSVEPVEKLARVFNGKGVLMLTGTDVGIAEMMEQAYGIAVLTYSDKMPYADYLQGDTFGFIPNIDTVVDVIYRKLQKNEKVIFFSSSIKEIEEVQEKLMGKTMVVISEYNKNSVRLCGRKRKNINALINEEMVPDGHSVVLATKAADVGININDAGLKTIIVSELCIATALQEINRKRRDTGEKIDLYFLLPNGYRTSSNYEKFVKELKDYNLYKTDYVAWQRKHDGEYFDGRGIVCTTPGDKDANYKINVGLVAYYHYMIKTLGGSNVSNYKRAVERALGWAGVDMLNAGKKTLDELVGVKLATKEEKRWLIELFKEMGNYKSATYLNTILEALGLPYKILTSLHKELPPRNGKRHESRSAWMLVRTDQ